VATKTRKSKKRKAAEELSAIGPDTLIGHVVFYAGERYLKELIIVAPQWPADLDRASIELTIPQGKLTATIERDGDQLIRHITAPAGCTVLGPNIHP